MTTLNGSPVNGNPVNGNPLNGHSLNGHSLNGRASGTGGAEGVGPFEEVDVQRSRLEADIVAALARTAAANERLAARDTEVRAVLQAELLDSKATLARMEQEYEMAIAMVQQAAQDEVARIMAAARQEIVGRRRALEQSEGPGHGE